MFELTSSLHFSNHNKRRLIRGWIQALKRPRATDADNGDNGPNFSPSVNKKGMIEKLLLEDNWPLLLKIKSDIHQIRFYRSNWRQNITDNILETVSVWSLGTPQNIVIM